MLIVIHCFGQIKLNFYRVSTEPWVASWALHRSGGKTDLIYSIVPNPNGALDFFSVFFISAQP